MSTLSQTFQWLAMVSGFANSLSFLPQMWRLYCLKTSHGLSVVTFTAWLFILGIGVIHLFLQKDYLYGTGLASSWLACGVTFLMVLYYRRQGQTLAALVRTYVEGWVTGDSVLILSTLHCDCVITESHGAIYRGLGAVRQWYHEWSQHSSVESWEITSLRMCDDAAAFEWKFICVDRGERKQVIGCSFAQIRDGRIAQLREYRLTGQPYVYTKGDV